METIIKIIRFFYLLWGGLLLGTLAINNRIQLPVFWGHWTWLLRFLFISWGRGLLLGIAIAMFLAAMVEVWELIGQFLKYFSQNKEGNY
jgi:hypothetical protein